MTTQYIVIYRKHGELNIDTKYYGPFNSHEDAYEYLCLLPALGMFKERGAEAGCKYVQELTPAQVA